MPAIPGVTLSGAIYRCDRPYYFIMRGNKVYLLLLFNTYIEEYNIYIIITIIINNNNKTDYGRGEK